MMLLVVLIGLTVLYEVSKLHREYKEKLANEINKERIKLKLENKRVAFEDFKSYINSKPDLPLEDEEEVDIKEVDEENKDTLVPSVEEFKQVLEFWTRNDVFDDNIRKRIEKYSVNEVLNTFYV